MVDSVAVIALVVSVLTAISHLHLRRINFLCINSECYRSKSVPPTPIILEQPKPLEDIHEKIENNLASNINTNGS